jgi:hypothetical protein
MLGINPVGAICLDGLDDIDPPYQGNVLTMTMDTEAAVELLLDAEPKYLLTMANDVEDVEA